jgi:branched-chain amino acid transport system substrate-binding protein
LSKIDRRGALRWLAACGFAGSLTPIISACGSKTGSSDTATKSPITVGLIVPQSGNDRAVGEEIYNGFTLYLTMQGTKLGGHPIKVKRYNEGETPASAATAAETALKDGAQVLVGISNSESLNQVRTVVENYKVPLLTPSPAMSSLQSVYVWCTGFTTNQPGEALGAWVANHVDGRVFVMAADGSQYREDVRSFSTTLKAAGGQLYDDPVYAAPGTADFTSCLAALKSSSIGALFCSYSGSTAVDVVKRLRAAKIPAALQVYGPGFLTDGAILSQQGNDALGIYTAMNYSADLSTEGNRLFVANYQKTYTAAPSAIAVASYDAGAVLDQALALLAGEDSGVAVNGAIGKLGQVASPRGYWQFNQTRSPLQKWFLRQVKSDGPVLSNVLTAELKTLG